MRLRVGLIGLGDGWRSCHLPALRALSDRFEVRAVYAQVSLLAEQAAREFDADAVDGIRALAARRDVDAVLMLSSDWFGALPILAACEQGKAIYCAAPLEIDLTRAESVRRRVEQSGIAFMAEFPRRNTAATLRLKELIATRLGAPRLLFCHARHAFGPSANGAAPRHSATKDMMELVDWCRYVVGQDPSTVTGVQHRSVRSGDSDYQMLSLDFSPAGSVGQGPLAHISSGNYMDRRWKEAAAFRTPAELQVCCERGVAFLDLPTTLIWFDEAGRHHESLDSERPVGEQMLTQFYRAVTSLVRKAGDLEDAYRALHIVLQARQSFRHGQRMPLDFS